MQLVTTQVIKPRVGQNEQVVAGVDDLAGHRPDVLDAHSDDGRIEGEHLARIARKIDGIRGRSEARRINPVGCEQLADDHADRNRGAPTFNIDVIPVQNPLKSGFSVSRYLRRRLHRSKLPWPSARILAPAVGSAGLRSGWYALANSR